MVQTQYPQQFKQRVLKAQTDLHSSPPLQSPTRRAQAAAAVLQVAVASASGSGRVSKMLSSDSALSAVHGQGTSAVSDSDGEMVDGSRCPSANTHASHSGPVDAFSDRSMYELSTSFAQRNDMYSMPATPSARHLEMMKFGGDHRGSDHRGPPSLGVDHRGRERRHSSAFFGITDHAARSFLSAANQIELRSRTTRRPASQRRNHLQRRARLQTRALSQRG